MSELQPVRKRTENFWLSKGLHYVLILAVIGAFCGLAVSLTYRLTAPLIAANEHARLIIMLEKMLPEADEYKLVTNNDSDIYFGVKNREVIGAVVPGQVKGFYGDNVEILALVNPQGEIKDVVILRHKETPGIGDKIEERLFLSQFEDISKMIAPKEEQEFEDILIAKVDIISGATVSSQAVIKGVAQAMNLFMASSLD